MKTLSDMYEPYKGVVEYNGIVKTMINWYYGYFTKQPWCAISMSYMATKLGIIDQFGSKNDNVYGLLQNIKAAVKKTGKGELKLRGDTLKKGDVIKRGTVVFILKSDPPMSYGSAKHVTTCAKEFTYKGTGTFVSLGGNQDNFIKEKNYPQSQIWAVFYPDYQDDALREGDKGSEVKTLQQDLNYFGYRDGSGDKLKVDGSFGAKTLAAVKGFQKDQKLTVDGVYGPKSQTKMDALRKGVKTITTLAILKVRKYPTADSEKCYHNIPKGKKYIATRFTSDYAYLTDLGGWVTKRLTN